MLPKNNIDIVAHRLYEEFYGEPMDEYVDEKERAFWRRKAQVHVMQNKARLEHLVSPDEDSRLPYDRMSQLLSAGSDFQDTAFRRSRGKSILGVDGKRVNYCDLDE